MSMQQYITVAAGLGLVLQAAASARARPILSRASKELISEAN